MNYQKYAVKAEKKITQYGSPCLIRRKADPVYDETTDSWSSTETVINGKAVEGNFEFSDVNGTSIHIGDVNLIAVFESAPVVGDVLDFADRKYNIVIINPVRPDGKTVILYDILAR